MQIVRWLDLRPEAWRNGGGTTREIWREPSGGNDFHWRASVAEVETPGPFSLFPGYQRIIMPLSRHGMRLVAAGSRPHNLLPLVPFAFPGDAAVAAELPHGPVTDFNFIVRCGAGQAELNLHTTTSGEAWQAPDGARLVFVVTGGFDAGGSDLGLRDSAIIPASEPLSLTGQGMLACCRIAG
jgi:environmental stress-induced protein Ves